MNEQIPLVIVLQQPPAGVDFGLQKGSGNSYETVQKQRSASGDLYFEFTVTLKRNKDSVDADFKGPFVQGPLQGRFVYIDIGTLAGQTDSAWSRRLKIPLQGISFDMIDRLQGNEQLHLETRIAGTGKDGGPTCGTVKPFEGWKITLRKK